MIPVALLFLPAAAPGTLGKKEPPAFSSQSWSEMLKADLGRFGRKEWKINQCSISPPGFIYQDHITVPENTMNSWFANTCQEIHFFLSLEDVLGSLDFLSSTGRWILHSDYFSGQRKTLLPIVIFDSERKIKFKPKTSVPYTSAVNISSLHNSSETAKCNSGIYEIVLWKETKSLCRRHASLNG